jgi:L-fucose isomerase-like protein
MTTRLGFVAIARPTFDIPLAEQITAQIRSRLTDAGFDLVGPQSLVMSLDSVGDAVDLLTLNRPALLIALQATFADSTMIAELSRRVDLPLLLWAVPEARDGGRLRLNSFCGINLAGHSLRRAGIRYDYLYAAPDDPQAINQVHILSRAAEVYRRLHQARVGRVGENPDGFETCLVDREALKQQLGLDVVQLGLNEVFDGVRQADSAAVAEVAEVVGRRVTGISELDAAATERTFGTYLTLREMVANRHLNGLAVRCWPEFFTELGCSACGAMSMLSDEAIPASCEADVNGTITQLMLQWISGEPAFGADVVAFDVAENVAVVWHCGLAPLSMADPAVQPHGTIHSNRKMPLLMEFPLKPGRVTIARLSQATGSFRMVIGAGEMLQSPPSFSGTSGTLRFDSGAQSVMDTIMAEGLEHHISLTYGDHVDTLLALAKMLDMPVLRL